MDVGEATKLLEGEWEQPEGFFGRLREGVRSSGV